MKKRYVIFLVLAVAIIGALAFLCRPVAVDRGIDLSVVDSLSIEKTVFGIESSIPTLDTASFTLERGTPEFDELQNLLENSRCRLRLTDVLSITGRENVTLSYVINTGYGVAVSVSDNGQLSDGRITRHLSHADNFFAALDEILDGQ